MVFRQIFILCPVLILVYVGSNLSNLNLIGFVRVMLTRNISTLFWVVGGVETVCSDLKDFSKGKVITRSNVCFFILNYLVKDL